MVRSREGAEFRSTLERATGAVHSGPVPVAVKRSSLACKLLPNHHTSPCRKSSLLACSGSDELRQEEEVCQAAIGHARFACNSRLAFWIFCKIQKPSGQEQCHAGRSGQCNESGCDEEGLGEFEGTTCVHGQERQVSLTLKFRALRSDIEEKVSKDHWQQWFYFKLRIMKATSGSVHMKCRILQFRLTQTYHLTTKIRWWSVNAFADQRSLNISVYDLLDCTGPQACVDWCRWL